MSLFRHRKLSAAQRLEIIDKAEKGYTHSYLADIYGVSKQRISQIVNASDQQLDEWEKLAALPSLEEE